MLSPINSLESSGRIATLVSESNAGIVHLYQHFILQKEHWYITMVSCKWILKGLNSKPLHLLYYLRLQTLHECFTTQTQWKLVTETCFDSTIKLMHKINWLLHWFSLKIIVPLRRYVSASWVFDSSVILLEVNYLKIFSFVSFYKQSSWSLISVSWVKESDFPLDQDDFCISRKVLWSINRKWPFRSIS